MGVSISLEKVSACDIRYIQEKCSNDYVLITTIDNNNTPLIKGTVHPRDEEAVINGMLRGSGSSTKGVIVYGKNSQDMSVINKYKQLLQLNIGEIYIYTGGLFEWLLLYKKYPDVFLLNDDRGGADFNIWDFSEPPNNKLLHM